MVCRCHVAWRARSTQTCAVRSWEACRWLLVRTCTCCSAFLLQSPASLRGSSLSSMWCVPAHENMLVYMCILLVEQYLGHAVLELPFMCCKPTGQTRQGFRSQCSALQCGACGLMHAWKTGPLCLASWLTRLAATGRNPATEPPGGHASPGHAAVCCLCRRTGVALLWQSRCPAPH